MPKPKLFHYLGGCALIVILLAGCVGNQKILYSAENAHSHNDYAQTEYFTAALNAGFGSMEADIFLVDHQILVAHSDKDLDTARNMINMYLQPLNNTIRENNGYPYKDQKKKLQLLIDLKDANTSPAYLEAVALLKSFPSITGCKQIILTFTGNIPPDSVMEAAPEFIYFDGVPYAEHHQKAMDRMYMLSDDFDKYSKWDGIGEIPGDDSAKLAAVVKLAHKQKKKVRFWNAPDHQKAWELMKTLGVDYINTDHIKELAQFLEKE